MSAPCCTAASRRSSGRRSCGRRRSTRRAIRFWPSWTKSAISLLSPSSPTPRPSPSPASRWGWVVGLVVTLALLAWALHGVDARQLVGHLRRADPLLLTGAVVLATLTFPLRTLGWGLILRDVSGGGAAFPLLPLWHATAIGFMANNLLPVRAGEFARAYVAQQQLPVRFSTALASVGVERVFDGLLLVGLMTLAIASPAFPGHARIGTTSVSGLATGAAAFFGAVLVVAVLVVRSEEHTSELQSPCNLVCRLLLEKKKKNPLSTANTPI